MKVARQSTCMSFVSSYSPRESWPKGQESQETVARLFNDTNNTQVDCLGQERSGKNRISFDYVYRKVRNVSI